MKKHIVSVAIQCVRLMLPFIKDERIEKAILSYESFYEGKITFKEFIFSRNLAYDAYNDIIKYDEEGGFAPLAVYHIYDEPEKSVIYTTYAFYANTYKIYKNTTFASNAEDNCVEECVKIIKKYYPKVRNEEIGE